MALPDPDTEQLLREAAGGSTDACGRLLERHRPRLERMVALRMDKRLAARLDAADVVMDALAEAVAKLPAYLRERPLPFFPWLRSLAGEHLATLHRRHVRARGRSVLREEAGVLHLPDESAAELASRLVTSSTSPTQRALRQELRERVQQALGRLSERDREVLVLRNLEQLSVADTAEVLQISTAAVKMRHMRALERLHALLAEEDEEEWP